MPLDYGYGITITSEAAFLADAGEFAVWDSDVWDTALWGPDVTYVDISDRLRSFTTSRRFSRDIEGAWQAGTCTATYDNRDGALSSDNLTGPYAVGGVTSIRPWVPWRHTVTYAGTSYPLWAGYAVDYDEQWKPSGEREGDAVVVMAGTDEFGNLASDLVPVDSPVGVGELFGPRLHRILDAAGHTGGRAIDEGSVQMQGTTLSSGPGQLMQLTADSEGGAVWVGADGTVIGARRYALFEEDRSREVQVTFGDGDGEIPYTNLTASYDGSLLVNLAQYTVVGGTPQVASDGASRTLYRRTAREVRTDLIATTDAVALELAQWKVARYAHPERRITSITIEPLGDPETLMPIVLSLRERDLVRVIRRPPSDEGHTIDRFCFISGIRHSVAPERWTVTYELWSATQYVQFGSSFWDEGLWGASADDSAAALWFF